jgi:hypothetical protein
VLQHGRLHWFAACEEVYRPPLFQADVRRMRTVYRLYGAVGRFR